MRSIASPLEGRTKIYGVGILVGEATRARVKDVVFREIDRIKVKGKDEAITIYEPLGLEGEGKDLELWEEALRAYRARRWDEAEVKLLDLHRVNQKRRDPPPSQWDGVSVFDEK
jgi:adenylate cyclase